jgi:hypothetical protein
MNLDAATKTKISSLTSVEQVALFCSLLLQDTYQNLIQTEGLDSASNQVKASVATADLIPVVLVDGTKTYKYICRLSLNVTNAVQYKAAKWSYVTDFDTTAPNSAIVNTANNT